MAKITLQEAILSKTLRSKSGEIVFNPVANVGKHLMIIPPDGKVLVIRAESIQVDFAPGGFPKVSVSGILEEYTSTSGVLLEATQLDYAPLPTKPKRIVRPV